MEPNPANNQAPQNNAKSIKAEIVQNIPVKQPDTPGVAAAVQPAAAALPKAQPAQPVPQVKAAQPVVPKAPKPAKAAKPHKSSLAILMAVVVAGALMAAAFYAFKDT